MLAGLACTARPARHTPAPRIARPNTERAGFVVRLGVDTIMVERFSVSQGVIEGDIVDRSPKTTILHYAFSVDSGGRMTHLEVTQRAAEPRVAQAPIFHLTVERVRDAFDVVIQEGDSTRRRLAPVPAEAIPLFARSMALDELIISRLQRAGTDSIVVPILDLDSSVAANSTVRRLGADSVVISVNFPRGEHARIDAAGRILGVSGFATSYKWLTDRVDDLDAAALAQSFAERDAKGAALGNYSSRDTARAVIDGTHIAIEYGRPSKRGRVIFGGLVPWNEVWRTGADLATHLTTDRDLRLDGLIVPVGTYTLYTLPSPAGWKLIVNRRTGQNGLVYDSTADLGRVAMATTLLSGSTERLTITVERAPVGGVLRIMWDNLIASVPLTVVPASSPRPY